MAHALRAGSDTNTKVIVNVYFPLPLELEQVTEKWFMVIGGFDAIVEEDGKDDEVIHVPDGYLSNLASVPRLPFSSMLIGVGNRAAVTHDFLYASADRPRAWCDAVFLAGLQAIPEIKWYQARSMYLAVRAAGWAFYGKPSPDMPVLANYSDLGIPDHP